MSGFEKRGHLAPAIFERSSVFKCLLLSQTLLKLNELFCIIISFCLLYIKLRAMVPNMDEWQQVENMRVFENYRREVTPFLKSAHILAELVCKTVVLLFCIVHKLLADLAINIIHLLS